MNDERLRSEAQRQAAEWVRALPEEVPGMAWRAALNEKVRAEAELRTRRRRWRWTLASPALGLAATAALALVLLMPRSATHPTPTSHLEASLVALHEQSVQTADIVGTGLSPNEASVSSTRVVADPVDDLDAGVL